MVTFFILSLNLLIMKQLILIISLFLTAKSYGQSLTINNNSPFEIRTVGFTVCSGTSTNYSLVSGSPSTTFALGVGDYGYFSSFCFISGGVQYNTPNPIGDNTFCVFLPPTGLNLTETATGGGNSVTFTWSVDLSGNVTVDAF
jgi:hypothetical protein